MEDWKNGGFGLYVHWPFCLSKCPYCDFNSHVASFIDQTRWKAAYLKEITRLGAETQGRLLQSVYFGGGTPSLMDPEIVADIISCIRATWRTANDLEITLEANPTSIEVGRLTGFREGGVNRVSMGMQALNDEDLRRLGRTHTVAEGLRGYDIARSLFDRVNFDLIYARQGQSLKLWQDELSLALSLAMDHMSLYQLTIEDGTVFAARHRAGQLRHLPDEDLAADMYDLTQEMTAAAGLAAYEVSNHARPDAESRHNLIYWRAGDYAGVGPGAHGRLTLSGIRWATEAPKSPQGWLDLVEEGNGELPRTQLTPEDRANEYLMMGLRLTEGIDLGRLERMLGRTVPKSDIAELEHDGLLIMDQGKLRTSPRGRALLNAVLRRLAFV